MVSLTNTDTRPLLVARRLWGGSISKQTKESRPAAVQDLYRWSIYGQKSRKFLQDIRPMTKIKAEQIDIFLSLLDVIPSVRGQRRAEGATALIESGAERLRLIKRGAA